MRWRALSLIPNSLMNPARQLRCRKAVSLLDILGYVSMSPSLLNRDSPVVTCRVRRRLPLAVRGSRTLVCLCLGMGLLAGCSRRSTTAADAAYEARKAQQEKLREAAREREDARLLLDQIPPPAKSRYLAVHTQDNWSNPFLIVGRQTVNLRIIYPDANPSTLGQGGMLRPSSARQETMDVRLADLPKALAAIPQGAWPYGRVIAVEEGSALVKADKPQVRRNVEATIQLLNDLGIVVDEWTGPNGSLLR